MANIPLVVLLTLTYICFCMLGYIFRRKMLKRLVSAASIVLLAVSAVTADTLFILLIAFDILDLISCFTGNIKVWVLLVLAPSLFTGTELLPVYLLVSIFRFFVYLLSVRLLNSVTTIKNINERLRDKSDELRNRLLANNEYGAQVRYLSQLEECSLHFRGEEVGQMDDSFGFLTYVRFFS
jgi:hypothetical protein